MAEAQRASSTRDAFTRTMASPRLASVKYSAFGDKTELDKVATNPRVIWVPTGDKLAAPDTLGWQDGVIDGKRVLAHSILLRKAGVNIYLFTAFGPSGQDDMEWLINELLVALHETLGAMTLPGASSGGNYDMGDLQWFPRGAISQQSIEVVLPLRVYVPVWQTDPAQLVGYVRTNLT